MYSLDSFQKDLEGEVSPLVLCPSSSDDERLGMNSEICVNIVTERMGSVSELSSLPGATLVGPTKRNCSDFPPSSDGSV